MIVASLPCPRCRRAQPQPTWFGTWKLNLARSTYSPGPPPFKRATRRIAAVRRRGITIVDEMVRTRGGDHPSRVDRKIRRHSITRFKGWSWCSRMPIAASMTAPTSLIQKIDGEVVATSRLTMSPDGKTITTVNSSRTASATTIYEGSSSSRSSGLWQSQCTIPVQLQVSASVRIRRPNPAEAAVEEPETYRTPRAAARGGCVYRPSRRPGSAAPAAGRRNVKVACQRSAVALGERDRLVGRRRSTRRSGRTNRRCAETPSGWAHRR